MQLIPRIRAPVNAVRVTEDLVVNAGDWLIFFEGDVVRKMTDDEVRASFITPGDESLVTPRDPPRRSADRPTDGPLMRRAREVSARAAGRRVVRTIAHSYKLRGLDFGSQMVRILDCLYASAGQAAGPVTTEDLRRFTHVNDRGRVASRLGDAKQKGLVTSDYTPEGLKRYTLTDLGLEVVRNFGEDSRAFAARHQSGGTK